MVRFRQITAILFFVILFCNILFAQNYPFSPANQTQQPQAQSNQGNSIGGLGQTPTLGQQFNYQEQQPKNVPTLPQPPRVSEEKYSQFEQYVGDKVAEINEFQLEIFKRLDGISFQYSEKALLKGTIAIPVRIVKISRKMVESGTIDIEKGFRAAQKDSTQVSSQIKELEITDKPIVIDAGYLVGSLDSITRAFKILGLRLPFVISTDIKQFGYELFRQPPSTFAPADKVPVGPDYVLGPGDEVKITIWGGIEGNWNVFVDSNGNIQLPKAGVVNVAGHTYKELKEIIHREMSRNFANFEINVSMGQLRSMQVFVIGNAERPGSYMVSSFSNVVNALFEAGGPSKSGTMRDIHLKRNGKTVVRFDMYDFLLKGDKSKDVRLAPEDVVFIPPVSSLVAITGSVNNPAIYELKGETSMAQLIEMAGGLNAVAYGGRVQIERIVNNNKQVVYESDLKEVGGKGLTLQSGDVLKIFQIVPEKRVVKLFGAVQREGNYGLRPGMTVKDIISLAGGLKYFAYTKEAELTRYLITDEGPKTEMTSVKLEEAMAGNPESNVVLREDDYLFIRSVPNWQLQQTVTIQGEVRFSGEYPIKKGEKISSLLERAGGYSDNAYLRGAVFTRLRVKELQQKNMTEVIGRLERELLSASSAQISVATTPEEVVARKSELEQKQQFLESLKKLRATGRLTIRLAHLRLLKGSDFDIELENGDALYIPASNNIINVVGSVMSQGTYIYSESLDYKDYVELAGGASRYADTDSMYVIKTDGSAMKIAKGFFNWSSSRSRWEMAAFGESIKEIEAGDTIVVPEKLERKAWMREIKDISQIIANIAISAGVVKALY